MDKRKIRLTESQLINLIKKSLVETKSLIKEGTGTAQDPFTDTDLMDDVERVVDLMDGTAGFTGKLAGIVTGGAGWTSESDLNEIKKILEKYKGKYCKVSDEAVVRPCLKRFMEMYEDDEGDSLYDDLKSLYQSRYGSTGKETRRTLMNWLEADKDKQDVAKTAVTPTPTPTPNAQTTVVANFFKCLEGVTGYQVYGEGDKQHGKVPYKGGELSFFLNGSAIAGYPNEANVLLKKGGKTWSAKCECVASGPDEPGGLKNKTEWVLKA
jgi:hypothetical protein